MLVWLATADARNFIFLSVYFLGCVQRQVWPKNRLGELLGQLWQLSNITDTTPKCVLCSFTYDENTSDWIQDGCPDRTDVGRMQKMAGVAEVFLKADISFLLTRGKKNIAEIPEYWRSFPPAAQESHRHFFSVKPVDFPHSLVQSQQFTTSMNTT